MDWEEKSGHGIVDTDEIEEPFKYKRDLESERTQW